MLSAWIKKIYKKLPLKIRLIILNCYLCFKSDEIYQGNDHFPINFANKLTFPLFGEEGSKGYYYRLYYESEAARFITPEDLYTNKYEIIYGELKSPGDLQITTENDSLLPICLESERRVNNQLTISCGDNKDTHLCNLPTSRFHYFKLEGSKPYKLTSNQTMVVGRPLSLIQQQKNRKKLVLVLFVDGLSELSQVSGCSDEKIMPNTAKFFAQGLRFRNHFSTAEWTLPSVPTFFTGCSQHGHRFYSPKANHIIESEYPLLSEIFNDNGYLTFQANGQWRSSPAYGYVKGFDRTVYQRYMDVHEVTRCFMEHMRAFPERDQFVWLTFLEAHHVLNVIPDISNQALNCHSAHCVTPWYDHSMKGKEKSVFRKKSDDLSEIYMNEVTRLDYYLKVIYDYIRDNYHKDEVLVTLVSDHGQAFLSEEQNPLSNARTRVPWFLTGADAKALSVDELTENTDVYKTLIHTAGLKHGILPKDSRIPSILGGERHRSHVYSQSVYPGQSFKAIIRTQDLEYRYETKGLVSADGIIEIENGLTNKVYCRHSGKIATVTTDIASAFDSYLNDKVTEWNAAIH